MKTDLAFLIGGRVEEIVFSGAVVRLFNGLVVHSTFSGSIKAKSIKVSVGDWVTVEVDVRTIDLNQKGVAYGSRILYRYLVDALKVEEVKDSEDKRKSKA